jgi:hypothetical protein
MVVSFMYRAYAVPASPNMKHARMLSSKLRFGKEMGKGKIRAPVGTRVPNIPPIEKMVNDTQMSQTASGETQNKHELITIMNTHRYGKSAWGARAEPPV